MKEIVVLSGKGGTGKSSLTGTLASLLTEKHTIVLADTDVDAPNLHLVLAGKEKEVSTIKASDKASIEYDMCSRCMECVDVCRFDSILVTDQPIIIPHSCEGCGACNLVCPTGAVQVGPVINGCMRIVETPVGIIVSGELNIGESSSGKLVEVVKNRARAEADSIGADLLLVDGPPGIGCPVIASVKKADYILLVTEPTPSALHDLGRVIETIVFFGIPCGVVLNRADLPGGTRAEVVHYLQKNNLPLLAEIPYDLAMPMALAEGELVVKAYPQAISSRAYVELSQKVGEML